MYIGAKKNEYWEGSVSIKDGVHIWDVEKVKKTFIWWVGFYKEDSIKNFDAYVDTKFIDGTFGDVCSGLIFRKSPDGWGKGGYTFLICNDSHFKISYRGKDGWDSISGWIFSDSIRPADWNRIEVSARDARFIFTINNVFVFEMTDDRQEEGGLAISIELNEKNPAVIWFDNFGYQTR